MEKRPLDVDGAFLVTVDRHEDERGYFEELYSTARSFPHLVGQKRQLNLSNSRKGVVRGMHLAPFAKLAMCLKGRLFDVVADVRPNSPTYLKWAGVWLDGSDRNQVYVPAGCAHGFFASENDTLLLYLQDGTYEPSVEKEINWRDPKLGIRWPPSEQYFLSDKDKRAAML